MQLKWIGVVCILGGCAGTGFSIASSCRREAAYLRSLIRALRYMKNALQYELCPLAQLCRQAGREVTGTVQEVFLNLARELEWQTCPDVSSCMVQALKKSHSLPPSSTRLLQRLGRVLGRFDLPGQLEELEAIRRSCEVQLQAVSSNMDSRLRSYQTLGICAGAALAILLV